MVILLFVSMPVALAHEDVLVAKTRSDSAGNYVFENVPDGSYTLVAVKYIGAMGKWLNGTSEVLISDGKAVTDVNITLAVGNDSDASINASIADANLQATTGIASISGTSIGSMAPGSVFGIKDASIGLYKKQDNSTEAPASDDKDDASVGIKKVLVAKTQCDASGAYSFSNVPDGNYTIVAVRFVSGMDKWLNGTTQVMVSGGQSASDVNISLAFGNEEDAAINSSMHDASLKVMVGSGSISGTVSMGKGAFVGLYEEQDISVIPDLDEAGVNKVLVAKAYSDSSGNFSFANVPDGNYTLFAVRSAMGKWLNGSVDLRIVDGKSLYDVNISLSTGDDGVDGDLNISLADASFPAMDGDATISGRTIASMVPGSVMSVRGVSIGLYKEQEDTPPTPKKELNVIGDPKIAFVVVGDDFIYMLKKASENLGLKEKGVNVSVHTFSRQRTINVSYQDLPEDLSFYDHDVVVLGYVGPHAFMGDSVKEQVARIVNTTHKDTVIIDFMDLGHGKNVDLKQHPELKEYWDTWRVVNAERMLTYILVKFCNAEGTIEPVADVPMPGIYHPDSDMPFEDIGSYLAWYSTNDGTHHVYDPANLTVGIPFRINFNGMVGNRAINHVIHEFESRGINVIPVYMHWVIYTSDAPKLFKHEGKWLVDAFVDMGSGVMLGDMVHKTAYLQEANVPVINAIQLECTIDEWEKSTTGSDYRFHYQIPIMEIPGQIDSIVVSGLKYDSDYGVMMDEPIPAQVNWMIDRTVKWATLKKLQNEDRKVAIIYYHNSPGRDGAMVAANLDVAPSISHLLEAMNNSGYDLNGPVPDQKEVLRLVLEQGRNIGAWVPNELETIVSTNEVVLLPVDEYLDMFNKLPEKARKDVIDVWGEAPGDVMVYQNESGKYFVFPKVSLGNIILAPQPTRGASNNTSMMYHDQTMPPSHQYIAFYLWLQHEYDADVVVHFGQHGTQEWLKGKGCGLSATEDWPALTIGDMPVVYIYNVAGISEGVVAKRRGNAVIVDHATPAIIEAGLYGDLSNIHQEIHLYTEADQTNDPVKQEHRKIIIEYYEKLGLEHELGQSVSNMTAMSEEDFEAFVITGALHSYLHEISSEYMPYGFHILGQTLEGEGFVSMVKSMLGSNFIKNIAQVYGDKDDLEAAHSPNLMDRMLADLLLNNTAPDAVIKKHLNCDPVDSSEVIASTISDDQGHYSFNNLSAGEYSVLFANAIPGMGGRIVYKQGDARFALDMDKVQDLEMLSSDETGFANVKAYAGNASISGQVYYISGMDNSRRNTSDARVLLMNKSVIAETSTDSKGYFTFNNLAEGDYRVVAYKALPYMGGSFIYKKGELMMRSGTSGSIEDFVLGSSNKEEVDSFESLRGNFSLSGQVYYLSGMDGSRKNSTGATVVLIKHTEEDVPGMSAVRQDLEKALRYAADLKGCDVEIPRVLSALEGGYIQPGLGDDPTRSPHVLPTGRNFYSFNPNIVPPKAVWNSGVKLADEFLEEWKANNNGEYPKKLAFVLWSAETMRHKGIMEAEILYLMGMQPVWDGSGNFVDVMPIPDDEMKHPRIDVVITMTGVYRETWKLQVDMMDRAARRAAGLNDSTVPNYLKQNSKDIYDMLMTSGNYTQEQAKSLSESRIFGPPSGSWGVGGMIAATSRSDTWDKEQELADLYMRSMSNIYGEKVWGEQHTDVFRQMLSGTESVLFSRSGNAGRGTSSVVFDHVYEFFGGLGMAIRNIDGKTPGMYVVNLKDSGNMKTETLEAFLARDMRSTYYNSKWVEGMMKHGYAGAQEFESVLDDLWGLQVTVPGAVTDDMWKTMYDIYVQDKYALGTKEWFNDNNPYARQTMLARMLEATRKQDADGNPYWSASQEVISSLAAEYQQSKEQYGPCCCALCCSNMMLDSYVQGIVTLPGMTPEPKTSTSSSSSKTGTMSIVDAASLSSSSGSSGNQTMNAEGGYGTDSSQAAPLRSHDNYVSGYEMQAVENSPTPSSSMSFSGASFLATVFVLVAAGAIYMGFRRKQ